MTTFNSDIEIGEVYRDSQTGFEGVATAVFFYQYGCERVHVEAFDKKTQEIRANTFDAPRLVNVKTGKSPKVMRTGGPGNGAELRPEVAGR